MFVCICVQVHICVCMCASECVCVLMCVRVCVCRQAHEHLCVLAHMYGYECGGQRTTSDLYTQVLFGLVFEKAVTLQVFGLNRGL